MPGLCSLRFGCPQPAGSLEMGWRGKVTIKQFSAGGDIRPSCNKPVRMAQAIESQNGERHRGRRLEFQGRQSRCL